MKNISNMILKSGLVSLIYENDLAFKKSLTNSLSLKLNEAIKTVDKNIKNTVMVQNSKSTEASKDLQYFVEFVQNYDSNIKNKFKFKNQSIINITEAELNSLKSLFNVLNADNRKTMVQEILESPAALKRNIEFYQKTKGLIQ
jgi:hypothetical protein